jgi:rubrerythrin
MQNQLETKLNKALMDEYHARNTYREIIAAFGTVRPFSNIVEAEQTHINFLLPLYEKYSIPVPAEPGPTEMAVPESMEEACRIAVQAEEENIALYDELLTGTVEPDIIAVFKQLQAASRDHHLPAFRRCLERGTSQTDVGGKRRGRGRGRGRRQRGSHGCRFV